MARPTSCSAGSSSARVVRVGSVLSALVASLTLSGCAPSVTLSTATDRPRGSPAVGPATEGGATIPTTPSVDPGPVDPGPGTPAAPVRPAPLAPVGSFVLGDSISLGAGPILSRLGYPVLGRVGQSATEQFLTEHLSSEAARSAPAWVLILGTNNPGDPVDVAALDDRLDLIERLRPATDPPRVFWVTPFRDPRYTGGLSAYSLDAFNDELARQAGRRPWLRLVDFATVARLHPEWFTADGSHLHPDDAGYAVLAALIAGPDAVPLLAPAPLRTLDVSSPEPSSSPSGTPSGTPSGIPSRRPSVPPATDGARPGDASTAGPTDEPSLGPSPAHPASEAPADPAPVFSPNP